MFALLCIATVALCGVAWAFLRQDRIYDDWRQDQLDLQRSYEQQQRVDAAAAERRDLEALIDPVGAYHFEMRADDSYASGVFIGYWDSERVSELSVIDWDETQGQALLLGDKPDD